MHHAIGAAAIVAFIGFAFGERAAKITVGLALTGAAVAFAYVMFLIITDQI